MIKTNKKLILTTFVGIMLFSNLVLAFPGVPHVFYGTVTWNGSPAPDGTTVTAKIDGVEVSSTTTKDGKYGYDTPEGEGLFYVEDPNNDLCLGECPLVNFFVNGIDTGQSKYFCNACITLLNLGATGGEVPPGPSPPGGGGGGGGGGIITPPTPPTEEGEVTPEVCEEHWGCSEWSACIEGVQTRTCNDLNNCGTNIGRPLENQPCTLEEIEEQETPPSPVGFFFLTPTDWLIGIIAGIMIAMIVIFLASRRRKKRR